MTDQLPSHVEILSPLDEVVFPDEWYLLNANGHFWFEWRLRALLKQFSSLGISLDIPLRVLDIGCGTGIMRDQMESVSGWVIDGAELNISALSRSRPGRGKTYYYNILDRREELRESYDLVFIFDVLEHIDPTEPFLRAALDHLRPGGLLAINVPSLRLLFSRYDTAAGHHRRYQKSTLRAEVEPLGMRVEDIRYWGASMTPLLLLRKLLLAASKDDNDTIIRKGFRPPGKLPHAVLKSIMKIETTLFGSVPVGSSLLMVARKELP